LPHEAIRSEPEPLILVRVGAVDENLLAYLSKRIGSVLQDLKPSVYPLILQPPREAFNPARRQFNSAKLLDWADGCAIVAGKGRALLVTVEDLYVPGLNFVFGQAQHPGRLAIISLRRLQPSFYGLEASAELLRERAFKEAVHELGHTYGLAHCQAVGCVMRFSNNISEVDAKTSSFCLDCAEALENARRKSFAHNLAGHKASRLEGTDAKA